MPSGLTTDYALGTADTERDRLVRQAQWLAPYTERFFREGGIGPAAEAKKAKWQTPSDIKALHRSASFVGDDRAVFNIGGNKYRLVVAVSYRRGSVFVRFVGKHNEYDRIDVAKV
jgi:mRNA interferase HigB